MHARCDRSSPSEAATLTERLRAGLLPKCTAGIDAERRIGELVGLWAWVEHAEVAVEGHPVSALSARTGKRSDLHDQDPCMHCAWLLLGAPPRPISALAI